VHHGRTCFCNARKAPSRPWSACLLPVAVVIRLILIRKRLLAREREQSFCVMRSCTRRDSIDFHGCHGRAVLRRQHMHAMRLNMGHQMPNHVIPS
jgi:hypothetical protein